MVNETLEKQDQMEGAEKFFFHVNNFDDDVEEEIVAEEPEAPPPPPPPPMFSEAALEAAKQEGFAQGQAQANQEAQSSRSKIVAQTLEAIQGSMETLFAQEMQREERYEQEAVALCLATTKRLFPLYNREHGLDELKEQIERILNESSGEKSVLIQVCPDYTEALQAFMGKLQEKNAHLLITVKADDSLAPGTAHLSWQDGGAVRDCENMAQQILNKMEELLAAPGTTGHDESENDVQDLNAPGMSKTVQDDTINNDVAHDVQETQKDSIAEDRDE